MIQKMEFAILDIIDRLYTVSLVWYPVLGPLSL